jgi:hypothetical protein
MKRYIILLLFGFLITSIYAQNTKSENSHKQRWEEMRAKRAVFYTEHIGFTANEARKFWPVYNELQEKKERLHRRCFDQFRRAKKDSNGKRVIDFTKVTNDMINMKVQEATLDKYYHTKFKKILSPEKLFKYYNAEREWAGQLLKEIEKRGWDKR